MPGGRPLKFENVKEMQDKIDSYFDITANDELTITGLALHLDTSRETLMNYEAKDEYFDTIKKAKLRIENAYEKRLIKRGGSGDIFALKNFGWVDKQEVTQTNINQSPFEVIIVDKHTNK